MAAKQGLSESRSKLHRHLGEGVYFSNRSAQLWKMRASRLAIGLLLGNQLTGMAKMFRPLTPYSSISKICLGLSRARAAHAGCVSICSASGRRRVAWYNASSMICELSR